MDQILINISHFPVSVFTIFLGIVIGYWLIALFGLFDLDFINAEVDLELDADMGQVGTIAGLLTTLGLSGVPITIVITLLALTGWFIAYFIAKLVPVFPEFFSWVELSLNIGVIIVSFMFSILVTAQIVRPLRKIFRKMNNEPICRSIIGRTCRVRSTRVDQTFGEVECIYQGASLILKVRSYADNYFVTGDQVVAVEHVAEDDSFLVVSVEKFNKEMK